jgi:recombinational DNA repair protein RecR
VHTAIEGETLTEIIFALPVTDYGDTTREYVDKTLKQLVGIQGVTFSTLARGLSSGLELEYVDRDTFTSAFERRK